MQPFHAANSMTKTPTSVPTNVDALTPEKVQQMVLSALSALGIQGKSNDISSPWFVDSGASNHMTGALEHLNNIHTYNGTQNIQIADGNTLSITAVGDITPSFRDVSPRLVSNLILVGQLVDNNCNINFSRVGCVCRMTCRGR